MQPAPRPPIKPRKSSRRLAPVDHVRGSSNERRLVRRKKHDGLGDLFRSTDSTEWHRRGQERLLFGSTGEAIEHPRIDRTRGDEVNAYSRCRGFQRSRLGQAFNCVLARCIYPAEPSRYKSYQMWLSTRDMARLGLLMVNGGVWSGLQVIPSSWVKESTALHVKSAALSNMTGVMGYFW